MSTSPEPASPGRVKDPKPAYVFDMDGTLTDVSAIRHLVKGERRDFHEFHSRSIDMPPNTDVVELARKVKADGYDVLIVTARGAAYRNVTAMWLALHNVPSDAMFMRAAKDSRPDYEVKKDILERILKTHTVVHAVDDNPNVLRLWEEHGIPTTRVPGWDEEEN